MPSVRFRARLWALLLAGFVLVLPTSFSAAQSGAATSEAENKSVGWICGSVLDETHGLVTAAELTLYPQVEATAPEPEPIARATSDEHSAFCLRDLPPGFYQLEVAKAPWPPQPPRTVEVRAGLVNRLTPIEMEIEPGEPRVSFAESFDGMPAHRARALMERLLLQGDSASLAELARRLLPKRGTRIDLAPLVSGLDLKPLLDELLRQLEGRALPPLKTARYVYAVGEMADSRTRDNVVQFFLQKLRDGRRLPTTAVSGFTEPGRTAYVSDVTIEALSRVAGKVFKWKYGQPPIQNRAGIQSANIWWREELARRNRDRKQGQGR